MVDTLSLQPATENDLAVEQLTRHLAEHGYAIVPNFLPQTNCRQLFEYATEIPPSLWQQAGIGRADNYTTNTQVRQDRIRWLSPAQAIENSYLSVMGTLRQQINRSLFMGLFDYECHLAHYPPGTFYRRHLDAFKGRSNRILSTVFYLNEDWQAGDGGELVIYGENNGKRGGKSDVVLETILPEAGKLVLFLSDTFVHEVLPGTRDRFSITGWFRLNASIGGVIDPTR